MVEAEGAGRGIDTVDDAFERVIDCDFKLLGREAEAVRGSNRHKSESATFELK